MRAILHVVSIMAAIGLCGLLPALLASALIYISLAVPWGLAGVLPLLAGP